MSEQAENHSLRKITKEAFRSILALKVAEGQEDLVGSNGGQDGAR